MEINLNKKKYGKNNSPGPSTYEIRAPYLKTSATQKTLETKFAKSERITFSIEAARSKKINPGVGKYDPKDEIVYKPMRKF